MRNDHTPGTEHFTDMLQNENARRLGPTVEGPRCEAVWAAPLRTVCCIFPAVTWKDARLAPLLVWDTPNGETAPHNFWSGPDFLQTLSEGLCVAANVDTETWLHTPCSGGAGHTVVCEAPLTFIEKPSTECKNGNDQAAEIS